MSLGEAIAALGILYAIPQLIKPIYRFRLGFQLLSIKIIYILNLIAFSLILISSLLYSFGFESKYLESLEIVSAILFALGIVGLSQSYLFPASPKRGKYNVFVERCAEYISRANDVDLIEILPDLIQSISLLSRAAQFAEQHRDGSSFYEFINREALADGRSAAALLMILSDASFCRVIIDKNAWGVARLLSNISVEKITGSALDRFIEELGKQAIVSPASGLDKEVGFKGFRAAPVLTQALFRDPFIVWNFWPIKGLQFHNFSVIDADFVRRYAHCLQSSLTTFMSDKRYWNYITGIGFHDQIGRLMQAIKSNLRKMPDNYDGVIALSSLLRDLVHTAQRELDKADRRDYEMLYRDVSNDGLQWNIFDEIASSLYEALLQVSYDFKGFEDPLWGISLDLTDRVYSRYEKRRGLSPLQQRLLIKIQEKLQENIKGYFPTLSRILFATIGPYVDGANAYYMGPYWILRNNFYFRVAKADRSAKVFTSRTYLPDNVFFDFDGDSLVHKYFGGSSSETKLSDLNLKDISLRSENLLEIGRQGELYGPIRLSPRNMQAS